MNNQDQNSILERIKKILVLLNQNKTTNFEGDDYVLMLENRALELLASEKMLINVLNTFPGVVFWKDINSKYLGCNQFFANAAGLEKVDEIVGKTDYDMPWANTEASKYIADDLEVMQSNKAKLGIVETQLQKDGKILWFETSKVPILDINNNVVGILGTANDITEKVKNFNELVIAKEKAEESDRLKTAFLQNMSHEIRTPLNAICGFTDLLTDPNLSEEEKLTYISIIQNSSNQLLSIVSDILTISFIESKQETINETEVDINLILNELYEIFKVKAQSKKVEIFLKPTQIKNFKVYSDHTKLIQILTNLLNNAIKFTEKGKIEIETKIEKNKLYFSIKDTGIGISEEAIEKIFLRFNQANDSISKNYGGNGLGLTITKSYVELLGGKISVNSKENIGSEFVFYIEFKPLDELSKELNETHYSERKIVLVVEDEETNYYYIQQLFKFIDVELIRAKNGLEAVEICQNKSNFLMILMDLKMPVLNGYEATLKIRKILPDVPIIAHTAYALPQDIENSKKYNFNDYITKPVSKNRLIEVFNKFSNLN